MTNHQECMWSAIWIDMFIKATLTRHENGPTGLIAVTTNLRKKEEQIKAYHQKESQARIVSDEIDQENFRNFLKTCIHPLDVDSL